MADNTIWQSSDGDMTAGASWSLGIPLTGDLAFWKTGSVSATDNLTSAQSFGIYTMPDYSGDLGSDGNPVITGTYTGRHVIRGSGRVYLGNNIISQTVVDSLNLIDALTSTARIGRLYIKRGRVIVAATGHFGDPGTDSWLVLDGNRATCLIEPQATGSAFQAATVRANSGFLENRRDFEASTDRLIIGGGTVLQTGLLKSTMHVYITGGGILIYEPSTDPASEAPLFFVDNGTLDIRDAKFTIPTTQVEIGRAGQILGSAIDLTSNFFDLDLREDNP